MKARTLSLVISVLLTSLWAAAPVAGSQPPTGSPQAEATQYTWSLTGSMNTPREEHTATLLSDGRVLVAGGFDGGGELEIVEVYDPGTGAWTATGSLTTARHDHTATLLPSGCVLVVGGLGGGRSLDSAEVYDPTSGGWTPTGSLSDARHSHTATLLADGRVLVVGGSSGEPLASAEIYDPATGGWTSTRSLEAARYHHTATLLPDGRVLVVGGSMGEPLDSSEVYNPAAGGWTVTGRLNTGREYHTATLLPDGRVLVAGGSFEDPLDRAEVYDPASGGWKDTVSLNTARYSHTATLLPDGRVLVAGGSIGASLDSSEVYDPISDEWMASDSLNSARELHTATLLPDGRVLAAGGSIGAPSDSAELYDPAASAWTATGSLSAPRSYHTATLLADGRVLVAAGTDSDGYLTASAEVYDPATGGWSSTGSLSTGRRYHSATLLADGRVLVAGGQLVAPETTAEVYDPTTGDWAATGYLNANRRGHTGTLLADGRVLIAGGYDGVMCLAEAEVYDPTSGTWSDTGRLSNAREHHTATLLRDGRVLVAGGKDGTFLVAGAEVYDPATGRWSFASILNGPRERHTATLLPDGRVLLAGGFGLGGHSPEVYDPATGGWTYTGILNSHRNRHTATLLRDGRVLVVGGADGATGLASAEVYEPASGAFTTTAGLINARFDHTATPLADGGILVAGGHAGVHLASAEVFDRGLGYDTAWQPTITTINPPFNALSRNARLELSGTQLQGVSVASGGATGNSATNYPLAHLRRIDNEQIQWLQPTEWSDTSLITLPLDGFHLGPAMITLFVNGIPSVSHLVPVLENLPPIAVGDSYTTTQGSTLIVTNGVVQASSAGAGATSTWAYLMLSESAGQELAEAASAAPPVEASPGVLANDVEYEDDPLTAWQATEPVSGTVVLNPDGEFIYVPDAGAWGTDHFDYVASDGVLSSTASISISILPTHPPEPVGDSYETQEDEVLAVVGESVLDNDTDPDGDPLTAAQASQPVSGTVVLSSGGEFIYLPDAGAWGIDHFDYSASDGIYTATAQVTITIAPVASAPLAAISPAAPNDADLSWSTDNSNCHYNVWQLTNPHQPPDSGLLVATLPKGSDFHSVPGVLGDPLTNYYFVIEAIGCAADSAASNEVGEFDFSLEPGG
jgi:uncharacterized delta-60 repeat protein